MSGTLQQTGTVTPGHAAAWTTSGVVQDAGTSAAPGVNSLGLYGLGGTPFAITNTPIPGAPSGPYSQIGLGISASAAYLSVNNFNGAAATPFEIIVNGVVQATFGASGLVLPSPLPIGQGGTGLSGTPTNGQIPIGNGTGYALSTLTAGANISITNTSGSVTISAVTGGGVLPVANGGTGATTATAALENLGVSAAMIPVVEAATAAAATAALGLAPFTSIATLRANTALQSTSIFVQGYYAGADGGEGLFWHNPGDTTSADNGGTIIVDALGGRWYRLTNAQEYSVHWFGAKGDGTTNDSAAVLATIAAVQAKGAGIVAFGPHSYSLGNATLAMTVGGVSLVGAGQFATNLLFTGGNNCITFTGPSYNSMISGNLLQDLSITCSAKTGGRALIHQYCFNAIAQRVYINNTWDGYESLSNNTVTLRDFSIAGVVGGAGTQGIYFHAPASSEINIELNCYGVLVNALWSGADGIVWDGPAYTLNLINTTMLDVHRGLAVLNTAASSTYYPEYLEAMVFTVDGASYRAAEINAGGNFKFTGCNIQNTSGETGQGSADDCSLYIGNDTGHSLTHELYFTNCLLGLSKSSAVYSAGLNVSFSACRFGTGDTMASGAAPAIHLAAGATDTTISDCTFSYLGNNNDWSYGVQADSGTHRTLIEGGNYNIGCVNGTFLNNSGDPNSFANNYLGAPSSAAGPVVLVPNYAVPPAAPIAGETYFNTATLRSQTWDGTAWNNLW